VADPAGTTVMRALPALGWSNVSDLSIAKTIRLTVTAESEADARGQVDEMCRRLLANPVIEAFAVVIEPAVSA
jgi:phosphoribosylformylglycinamidine synthase subunit PurS